MKEYNLNKMKYFLFHMILVILIVMVACVSAIYIPNIKLSRQYKCTDDLSDFDTPYTFIEKNKDNTYNLYMYTSPVQYKVNEKFYKINNDITVSDKKGYAFENKSNLIKTYFPKLLDDKFMITDGGDNTIEFRILGDKCIDKGKKVTYINLYKDEREAIYFELQNGIKIYAYPINTGIHFEYVIDSRDMTGYPFIPDFTVYSEGAVIENETDEYIKINYENKKSFLIYEPAVMNEKGELFIDNLWSSLDKNNQLCLTPVLKKLGKHETIHIEFSVQLHQEDMPDTSVYQNKKQNVYLSNYALIGEDTEFGQAYFYQRYRLNYFLISDIEDIIGAVYCTKNLNYKNNNLKIEMYRINQQ